ncbi:Uncharacterised protein [Chlamydia trachomatis]|nr:Uncharacterised protein [Chlamydia trachomatis]
MVEVSTLVALGLRVLVLIFKTSLLGWLALKSCAFEVFIPKMLALKVLEEPVHASVSTPDRDVERVHMPPSASATPPNAPSPTDLSDAATPIPSALLGASSLKPTGAPSPTQLVTPSSATALPTAPEHAS